MLQFLTEALVLCLLGGAIGVVVGAGGAMLMASAAHWNTFIAPSSVVLAFAFSAVVGLTFGLWPAWRAASLNTIDALRYE
jgi:putative ABC transport system permease protein